MKTIRTFLDPHHIFCWQQESSVAASSGFRCLDRRFPPLNMPLIIPRSLSRKCILTFPSLLMQSFIGRVGV